MMKIQLIVFGLVLSIVILAGCAKQPVLGGDKDIHGCIGSAGYSWCEAKQKCLRSWEENCTTTGGIVTDIQAKAKEYCGKENVASVYVCDNYIEVNSNLLGGGAKYIALNGTQFSCPVVAPDSMNKRCKAIFDAKLAETFSCKKICPSEECADCPMLSQPAPGWCLNGTIVAGEKDACGCQGPPTCLKACTEEAKICPDGSAVGRTGPNCEFAPCPSNGSAGLANPASKFCIAQGGQSKIITAADGSQSGACVLAYGVECDEWAYFRGECPAPVNCTAEQKAQQACTMEYLPVCGDDGVTYGNKCSACASNKINSYIAGECPVKTYVSRDPEQCKVIRFLCIKGKEAFTDDFGCGCKPVENQSTCGNGVCDPGEAAQCPACYYSTPPCLAPCTAGTCPKDCP